MNEMKISVYAGTILGCLALSWPMVSVAEWSANLGVVSLYKDRGVDQEGQDDAIRPALQGGLDYAFDNGLYVGNWNSTGQFGNAGMEVDLYAGYRLGFAQDWLFDVGYVHYIYPGDAAWNAGEIYASIGYQRLTFKVYRGMREEVNKNDVYYRLTYTHPIMERLNLKAGVGYLEFDTADLRGKFDYGIGLDYSLNKFLSLSGTIAGANRKDDVEDHSRDTRFILGLNAVF
ncbi:TorF family putative porin [Castellaniella defragrans]|uniref:Uncharacterized protein (TIGR02001 family) n=1 Tax=Castellaniella defragrans TaxID=75697 RepID=A0A7W9TMI7_CASDE|nr:TorF family putative porin [Castellaniella defragrans]MBB6083126.1 uncharacterized protein (TIGR02001 family) [Castellaniella defragrans]